MLGICPLSTLVFSLATRFRFGNVCHSKLNVAVVMVTISSAVPVTPVSTVSPRVSPGACSARLLHINHVATCDRFWLVACLLLDLSLADICGPTLDICQCYHFVFFFLYFSSVSLALFSCQHWQLRRGLIRNETQYEHSSLPQTCT